MLQNHLALGVTWIETMAGKENAVFPHCRLAKELADNLAQIEKEFAELD